MRTRPSIGGVDQMARMFQETISRLARLELQSHSHGPPPGLLTYPRVQVQRSSSQSIATSGSWTNLEWNQSNHDPDGWHSTSTNPTRITLTGPGMFLFVCNVHFAAHATGTRGIRFRKDGTFTLSSHVNRATATGEHFSQLVVHVFQPSGSAYFEFQVLQASGGALNVLHWDGAVRTTLLDVQRLNLGP